MRDIKKEMMKVLAKDFKFWHKTLNEEEKKEYLKIIEDLRDGRKANNT